MSISIKVRLVCVAWFTVVFVISNMAINGPDIFKLGALISFLLGFFVFLGITGSYICPHCGKNIYASVEGGRNMNPYSYVILSGKCSSCKKKL